MSKVLVIDCKDYEYVEEAVNTVLGEFPTDYNGKTVLLKPNMLNGRPPERHNTTHPSIIRALVGTLVQSSANVTVGDNPGTMNPLVIDNYAETSGIAPASLGHYRDISREPILINVKSRFTNQFVVSKPVIDADVLISLPKFKTHNLTIITGAIKNSFGILVGGEKQRAHAISGGYKNFAEILVDIYQIRKPDLVIMDAIVGMEGNGPSSGQLRHIGKIIASNDGVAVDAVMSYMMGKKPEKIYMLKIAKERGLGEIDISKIEVKGNLEPIKDFKMPSTFLCQAMGNIANNRITGMFFRYKPFIDEGSCKRCGVCVKSCPVGAITMVSGVPKINRKLCIQCYCCQELCPNDVIELRKFR